VTDMQTWILGLILFSKGIHSSICFALDFFEIALNSEHCSNCLFPLDAITMWVPHTCADVINNHELVWCAFVP